MLKSVFLALTTLGAVCALSAAPAMARDYAILDFEDDYSVVRVLDIDSISPVYDNIKSVWITTLWQGDKVEDDVVRRRALTWYDCDTARSAIRTIELYSEVGGEADDNWTYDDTEMTWSTVDPDTLGDETRNYVCGLTPVTADVKISADDDNQLEATVAAVYADPK